jgi:putative flavoprotein involved in K+ transport
VSAFGRGVGFEDGSELEVDGVVWATGYRPDYSWIHIPAAGAEGRLRHRRGVTAVPALYFLGLSWQHTRGSALLGWVAEDAEHIAERVRELATGRPVAGSVVPGYETIPLAGARGAGHDDG